MRVLIIRTSALGDVVHALPVLTALRRSHPDAHIGWVIESAIAPLLAGHPDLDEILPVSLRNWRHSPFAARTRQEVSRAVSTLRAFQADVTVDLMGNHKAGILARVAGGARRIGIERRARREPSSAIWLNEFSPRRGQHAVEHALSVVAPLGIAADPVDFGGEKLLREPPLQAEDWLQRHPEPYALIHPGAAWANKRYPPEAWGVVARNLRARTGLRIAVGFGPGEQALAEQVARGGGEGVTAVGAPSLAFLAALVRNARLVLGGDTGPLHLAHALGARVLFVMGPTEPARHGPYGDLRGALCEPLPCSFCYQRLAETKACLLAVPPERIVARALERLSE